MTPVEKCQYHLTNCHLPHTGFQLEHYAGILILLILLGLTLYAIGRTAKRN